MMDITRCLAGDH